MASLFTKSLPVPELDVKELPTPLDLSTLLNSLMMKTTITRIEIRVVVSKSKMLVAALLNVAAAASLLITVLVEQVKRLH